MKLKVLRLNFVLDSFQSQSPNQMKYLSSKCVSCMHNALLDKSGYYTVEAHSYAIE